jgi:hypothetical protein
MNLQRTVQIYVPYRYTYVVNFSESFRRSLLDEKFQILKEDT